MLALLLIDVQANMFDAANPVEGSGPLLVRLRALLDRARRSNVPVIYVRNNGGAGDPDVHGTPGWELHPELRPEAGEIVLDKSTCNTFESTELGELMTRRGITKLVIAGLQSDFCIRQTSLGALERGYEVTLAADGHSTYDGKLRTAREITAAVNEELSRRASLARSDEILFA